MISVSEMDTYMKSMPVRKTTENICQVYEKLFSIDPYVFTFPRFRQELVYSIDRNYPHMHRDGQAFVASTVVSFLLSRVFGDNQIFFYDNIILLEQDYYLKRILYAVQDHFFQDTATVYSDDSEEDDGESISIYACSQDEGNDQEMESEEYFDDDF